MILDYAKSQIPLLMNGGSNIILYSMLGTSGLIASGNQTTLGSVYDRQAFTMATTSANKITYTTDWNTVELSGLTLREFGLVNSGTGLTGSLWTRSMIPAIIFDGTNELRIEETIAVY